MKLPRLFAALSVFAAGACVAAASAVVTVESLLPQLDDILRKTVTQSPQMVSQAMNLELAEQDRIAHRAGLLPSVSGTYSYYKSREERADQTMTLEVPKQYYGLSISQPLFHWGERRNTARIGRIRQQIAEGNHQQAYHLLAQEVRAAYLRLILSKIRVHRATLARTYAQNQLVLGEQRLAQKVISDAAMFTIRITAERSLIDYDRAFFDLENDKRTLARLSGQPAPADDQIPDVIPAVDHQESAVQRMLADFLSAKDKPAFQAVAQLAEIDIERLTLANQKTRLLPKFNLVAGISQDEQRYEALGSKYQVNSTYGGFSVNWTVFDGFAARSGVKSSLARIRQLEAIYRSLDERLAQEAQSYARLSGFQARHCSISDRFLESAEGNLKSKKDEFARGVTSEEDVTGAEIYLIDSRLTALASRLDYYLQVGAFLGTVARDPVLVNLSANQ